MRVSKGAWRIVCVLAAHGGPMTIAEVADRVGRTSASTRSTMLRMERKGMLRRDAGRLESRRGRKSDVWHLTDAVAELAATHGERRPVSHALTDAERDVLRWIIRYIEAESVPPTMTEIADALGGISHQAVQSYIHRLAQKGAVERGRAAIRVLRWPDGAPFRLRAYRGDDGADLG